MSDGLFCLLAQGDSALSMGCEIIETAGKNRDSVAAGGAPVKAQEALSKRPSKMAEQTVAAVPKGDGEKRRRVFVREKKPGGVLDEQAAEAGPGKKSLQQVLDSIDPDKPESVQDLVNSFNGGQFAERTKKAQASAFDRFYVPLCEKMRWDANGAWTMEHVKVLAAVLEQIASIGNSRHIVFANIKAKIMVQHPLSEEVNREYSRCFARLKKDVVEQQEHPVLLSWWERADAIRSGQAESRFQLTKTKTVCLGQFLDFGVTAWYLMQRPDEFQDLDRETYEQSGEQRAHFFLRKSKVDQRGKGWSVRMKCCCAAAKPLKLKRKLCPVHACSQEVWTAFANTSAAHLRRCMAEVVARLGLTETSPSGRALWNLYSFRVGGASAARQGGLPQEGIQVIGRWKNVGTALRYEGDRSVNVTEERSMPWPVVRAEQLQDVEAL
eukprot:g6145.t1